MNAALTASVSPKLWVIKFSYKDGFSRRVTDNVWVLAKTIRQAERKAIAFIRKLGKTAEWRKPEIERIKFKGTIDVL